MAKITKLTINGKSVASMAIDGKKCFPLIYDRNLDVEMTTLEDIPGSYTYRLKLTYDGPEVDLTDDMLYPQMLGDGTYQIQKESNYAVVITVTNPSTTDTLEFIVAVKLPAGDGYDIATYIEYDDTNAFAMFPVQPAASV